MRVRNRPLVAVLATMLLLAAGAPAQEPHLASSSITSGDGPLRVAVADDPPYAMLGDDGSWRGIGVDLWREVAAELGRTYELVEVAPDAVLDEVADGRVDVGLNVVADAEAERRTDLLQPYATTSLAVAGSSTRSLLDMARAFFSPRFLRVVLFISLLLLVIALVVWLLERAANEEHFGGDRKVHRGLGAAFWWAGITMTTIGYGDKAPRTFWGRAVALVWALLAMAITASLTASLVSIVGFGASAGFEVPSELRDLEVGVVEGSPGERYLDEEGVAATAYGDAAAGLEALRGQEVDAFVHDRLALLHLMQDDRGLLARVQETGILPHRRCFAVASGSELREPLQRAILRRLTSSEWSDLVERYAPPPS